MSPLLRALLALSLAWACTARAGELPSDSLYQLQAPLTTQDGERVDLSRYQGQPVLVSMFYAGCLYTCPILVAGIGHMERELPAASRGRLRVLLVSLDPERDTPARLRELAVHHGADLQRWSLALAGAADVQKLAAALGIRYRRQPDGEISHASVVTLLDAQGRIVAQTGQVAGGDAAFMATLRAATER